MVKHKMKQSLKFKIILILLMTFGLSFVLLTSVHYHNIKQSMVNERIRDARDIRGLLMAVRRVYHQQFIDSGLPLNDKTLGFLPAHALSRISQDFKNWSDSGMRFNNVSDMPRNEANTADKIDLDAMAYFRQHPDKKERFQLIKEEEPNYYHYSVPIYIEDYCLKCHGDEKKAPLTIQQHYDSSFDYKKGDLRGLMSIKLPANTVQTDLKYNMFVIISGYLSTLMLSLIATYFLLHRQILKHFNPLVTASQQITQGHYAIHLPEIKTTEFKYLIKAFNTMAEALQQRKKSQQQMQTEIERYLKQMQAVFDNTPSVVTVKDLDGEYVFINRRAEVLLNQKSTEENEANTAYLNENKIKNRIFDLKMIKADQAIEYEQTLLQEEGLHTYMTVKFPLKNAAGKTYAICDIATDITKRKQMEKTLEAQSAIWQSLMASTSEGIIGMDKAGLCTFCNPTAVKLLGYQRSEEVVGQLLHNLIHHSHALGQAYSSKDCKMNQVITTGQPVHVDDEILWRADGQSIPVIYRATPFIEKNEITGVVVTFEEISEQIKTQQLLKQQLQELQQFNRLAVGRELKMRELKQEINALLQEKGASAQYKVDD
jgi:PAS domain S-box-containing protein